MNPRRLNLLLTTWEGGGSVPPVLSLARDLLARGHSVRVMSDRANQFEIERCGARFVAWSQAPSRTTRGRAESLRDWEAGTPIGAFIALLDGVMFTPALAYARDVVAELGREPADLVVASDMLFGVMAGCESIGQRFALFAPQLCLYPLPGMPCVGSGMPPPRTDAEREQHAAFRRDLFELLDSGLPALNATRAALGLPALPHTIDQLKASRALLLGTARAFDFPATLPAEVRYVGPQLAEPGWIEPWTPPWNRDDRRPLLAIGFSTTFQNHAAALQAVVDAAATLPVRALATLGGLESGEVRGADNVWVTRSAPHEDVMRDAAVVVTHGGHGTVMRALSHRRPLLVMPHGRDQNDNAVRVTERGAGLSLPPTADATTIRAALERLLWDPAFAQRAGCLGDAIADEARGISATAQIEALA